MSTALRTLPSELAYALAGLAVLAIVAFFFGYTNVLGALSAAISLAISLVVLYLFYRLVAATERIARATERLANDELGQD